MTKSKKSSKGTKEHKAVIEVIITEVIITG
jgi:hypothetical protein